MASRSSERGCARGSIVRRARFAVIAGGLAQARLTDRAQAPDAASQRAARSDPRASARSRVAGDAGERAARRAAQARSRSADQGRGAGADRARPRRDVSEQLAAATRARASRCSGRPKRRRRTSRRAWCGSTSSVAPATGACCSTSTICDRLGRAYRTASALDRIDRDRVIEHQRTLEALAKERQRSPGARQRAHGARDRRPQRRRAAVDRAVADRTALVAPIDARRDLNAQLTGELAGGAAEAAVVARPAGGGRRVAVALPLRPFQGALPWPARGRVVGAVRPPASSRFGTAIVTQRHRDWRHRRTARPRRPRRDGRLRRALQRLRQPRHRRARRPRLLALRHLVSAVRSPRGTGSRPQAPVGTVGTRSGRQPVALLRAARRRQSRRSLTMAEAAP